MTEKALKTIVYFAGIVCAYVFISIRVLPMFNAILLEKYIPEYWENTKYGELYYFNFIKNFQENNLPEHSVKFRFTDRHPSLEEADILTFGDSFFDFSRMTTYPEKLGQNLNKKVSYARIDKPLEYLKEHEYNPYKSKIVLYETAERFLPDRFKTPQPVEPYIDPRSDIRKAAATVRDLIFLENTELLINQLLTRSYFTTHIYSAIATLKFNTLGSISDKTPLYTFTDDRPWLFGWSQLADAPTGFYYKHSQTEIDTYCNNIQLLAKNLKENYQLDFVFMIIPSKYTIYHNLFNNDEYNNFIPRIHQGLKERNIAYINVYDPYIAQRDSMLLYYGTDTHWTENGLNIAISQTMDVFKNMENSETCFSETLKSVSTPKNINPSIQ